MAYLPIGEHGIIGNLHTTALVGTDGTIDWLCLPSFDSPSIFASILDDEKGGHFKLAPLEYEQRHQLYLPDTNVLVTRFLSARGIAEVTDFMPVGEGAERPRLIREVRVTRGSLTIEVDCRPAFDYARQDHTLTLGKAGAVFEGADMALGLAAETPLEEGPDGSARAHFGLKEGESVVFGLRPLANGEGPGDILGSVQCRELLQQTLDYWRRWSAKIAYRGRWREMVNRAALVLKLMTYQPTGAVISAPTMGLPEAVEGERNWDQRYTWLRDAAFAIYGLISLGHVDEAEHFVSWLVDRCRESSDGRLQALYSLDGSNHIGEEKLSHLSGYRGSGPVRLGNEAYKELHLDIYGPVLDAVYLHNKYGAPLDYDVWQSLKPILNWLADNWHRADEGMWEIKGNHEYVSSRVLSWVALERAVRIGHARGLPAGEGRWVKERDTIYEEVMEKGWDPQQKSFVEFYGADTPDASLLLMPLVKFVGPTDPRWISTLERIEEQLARDNLVYLYRPEEEDSFSVTCSFWFIECLTWAGRLEEARMHLEKLLSYANHLGLYGDKIGLSGESLGNFPKTFSHMAMISAAVHLDRALE